MESNHLSAEEDREPGGQQPFINSPTLDIPRTDSQAGAARSPTRPFPTNMGESEPQVKLVPITRKISKVKRGIPVHTCDQCPKTFTRAEHLRRHQLSHAAPDLRCHIPTCSKTFFRKDLLDRHVQGHTLYDNAEDLQITTESFIPGLYPQPQGMPDLPPLFIPDATPGIPSWQNNQTTPSYTSKSTYSIPSDNSQRHRFPVRTSSGDSSTHAPYQTAANETRSASLDTGRYLPFTYSASPPMYQPLCGDSMDLSLLGYQDKSHEEFYDFDDLELDFSTPKFHEDITFMFEPNLIEARNFGTSATSSTAATVECSAQAAQKMSAPISSRPQGQHVQQPYVRPGLPIVFCHLCNEHPEGFEDDGKLQQHKIKMHGRTVKKFVCRDPATVGLVSKVQAVNPLSNCQACSTGTQYDADYNAAAHLRRVHFDPRASRRQDKNNNDVRSDKGGGPRPRVDDLELWYTEIPVVLPPEALQVDVYPGWAGWETSNELDPEILAELVPHQFWSLNADKEYAPLNLRDQGIAKTGVPCTDSGYGSAPYPNHPANVEHPQIRNENIVGKDDPDDNVTTYSAATTVTPHLAHQYISELSNDLHSRFRECIDIKTWPTVFHMLPELIKAFAIKLGHESSSPLNRSIMYFLHKRHREFADHVDLLVRGGDEDVAETPKHGAQGMSLLDKMSMWNERAEECDRIKDKEALFEGVKDVEDDDIFQVEMSAYSEAILGSTAYQWFIAAVRKEHLIDRGKVEARAVVEEIRATILCRLTTGSISKRRPAPSSGVAFRLQWKPLELRLEQERARLGVATEYPLFHAVSVTGPPGSFQSATIMNYMNQTWPSSGVGLLEVLQQVVDGSRGIEYSVNLPDKSQVGARIRGDELFVTVLGPAHSLADCGEQLSWLAAALSPTSQDHLSHCTPWVDENPFDCYSSLVSSVGEFLTFDIEIQENLVEPNLANTHCLTRLVGNPSSVVGFPTARRPDDYFGLEIDRNILASIVKMTQNGFIFSTSGQKLEVLKWTSNVLLWHVCRSDGQSCSCCMRHISTYRLRITEINDLNEYRHIVDWCENLDRLPVNSKLSRSSTKEGVITDCGLYHREHENSPGESNTRSISTSGSVSRLATDSTGASFESDLFSDSDSLEDVGPLDRNDENFSILDSVVQTLLSGFRETSEARNRLGQSETSSGSTPGNFNPGTELLSTTLPLKTRRKRQRGQNDEEGSENEDMPPASKRTNSSRDTKPQPRFACPYWKRNSGKHRGCFSKILRRIRDVKQHLARKHTPEFYCECCFATFEDEESHRGHVTHTTGEVCVHDPSVVLDGITHQQHRRLSRKSDWKVSEQEQWFSVWDILFPGAQRPETAYLDSKLCEEISGFREYCFQHGPATLDQALSGGVPEIERRQQLVRICQTGFEQLFEAWRSSRDLNAASSRQASSSTSQSNSQDSNTRPPQCQPTPNSSLDSTVLTAGNPVANASQFHDSMLNPLPVPIYQHPGDILQPPQLSLGDVSNRYSRPLVQGDRHDFSDLCFGTWPLLDEPGLGETLLNPNVCDSVIPDSSGLDIEELLDFNRF
ncbi:hypothetical protein BGZ61DRAFT_587335 [Ilyonectria robusta]|uniref:uncharacterized protein n=1 Tax=Ilyonectria robusta TaxID=1079257 RepID=UPI001E8D71B4|nr:uncharacterized protein BGZ61DRAFT_587335 [Ilyonectria robusta]KAH8714635.1 hypothetical protein BGZ61DRAFT_587335 [Ilyonectria robusta]